MRKDISFPTVTDVHLAVVQDKEHSPETPDWKVYIINRKPVAIDNVMVRSHGYGKKGDEEQRTSELRHYLGDLDPGASALIEPISPDVFHLNNQYWVSYYIGREIFDKKFIFLPETIIEANLMTIEALGLQGILHE